MQELNLEVGQKVWSIQLGECDVYYKSAKLIYCGNGKRTQSYVKDGKMFEEDKCQSLFESNPFDQSVKANEMVDNEFRQFHFMPLETVSQPENKAELINALMRVFECQFLEEETREVSETKLQKLLESL